MLQLENDKKKSKLQEHPGPGFEPIQQKCLGLQPSTLTIVLLVTSNIETYKSASYTSMETQSEIHLFISLPFIFAFLVKSICTFRASSNCTISNKKKDTRNVKTWKNIPDQGLNPHGKNLWTLSQEPYQLCYWELLILIK